MVDLHVANPLCSSSLQNSKCWAEAEAGAELDEPGLDVAGTLVEEVEVFPDAPFWCWHVFALFAAQAVATSSTLRFCAAACREWALALFSSASSAMALSMIPRL